jgi:hypothetical protein
MKEYLQKIKNLKNGTVSSTSLENDPNFTNRKYPELLKWSLENLLKNTL